MFRAPKMLQNKTPWCAALLNNALRVVRTCLFRILTSGAQFVPFAFIQLMECCVNALVTSFKETILAECPGMIKRNETESEYGRSSGTKGSASSGWQWNPVPIYILPTPPHPSHHLCVCVLIHQPIYTVNKHNSIQLLYVKGRKSHIFVDCIRNTCFNSCAF